MRSHHHLAPASRPALRTAASVALLSAAWPLASLAYDAGSTGADGALTPTVNTEVVLPPSGVLNYTSLNIPTGVTVTFRKNLTNTPVVLLVSGNATIAGVLSVAGKNGADVGAAGSGALADDGAPGEGGPGGFTGGAAASRDRTARAAPGSGPAGGPEPLIR